MALEELLFEASSDVSEHAVMRFEDCVDRFARCEDVEACEEVVVDKSHDTLVRVMYKTVP